MSERKTILSDRRLPAARFRPTGDFHACRHWNGVTRKSSLCPNCPNDFADDDDGNLERAIIINLMTTVQAEVASSRGAAFECWRREGGIWVRFVSGTDIIHIPWESMSGHEILAAHDAMIRDQGLACGAFASIQDEERHT